MISNFGGGQPVTAFQIDFKRLDRDIETVDKNLLSDHPDGFIRNCTADEKIMVMQRMEKCPSHCFVKRGARLYLELPKELHYPGPI
jgi:hypothetical protein